MSMLPSGHRTPAIMRHPRQRASRACTMCHSRKIKCDALEVYPCTRCRGAGLPCELRISHRGGNMRKASGGKASGGKARRRPVDTQALHSQWDVSQGPRLEPRSIPDPPAREDLVRSFKNFLENPDGVVGVERGGAIVHATDNNALSSVLNTASGNFDDGRRNYHLYAAPSPSASLLGRYGDSLERLDPITRDFLFAKRILDLPEAHLVDHLVQKYFDHVDPHVPLIHKRDFLNEYGKNEAPALLMQSVMFVASHFADDEVVETSPWATRAEMAATFYEKARLIADFELEEDQITLIQSFVLLGERWVRWTDERNPRYWMSRAINVAVMMGLHRRIDTLQLSRSKALLWKRIIWVVLAWDRYTALAVGAPVLIDNRWTDACSASIEEFYFDENPEDPATECCASRSPATVKYSLTILILGTLLGEVHDKLHTSPALPMDSIEFKEVRRKIEDLSYTIPSLMDMELQDPMRISKSQLIYYPLLRAAFAVLSIFYHRPLVGRYHDPAQKHDCQEKLLCAAHDICEVMSYIRTHELFPLCPIWLVAGVFHTMAVLLSDCRKVLSTSGEEPKPSSFGQLRQLIHDLSILEDTWKPAGWFRELFHISMTNLQKKVSSRETSGVPEREPPSEAAQTGAGNYSSSSSIGSLYDSTRELFPDLDSLLNWNSGDILLWNYNCSALGMTEGRLPQNFNE